MKVLIDESLPRYLKHLATHIVTVVPTMLPGTLVEL
jgi:hypothetical protein